MSDNPSSPSRFIGLDIHKHYLVAIGVDAGMNQVYGPKRVLNRDIENWLVKELTPEDSIALEMTTNTWTMVDLLQPHVHSVTVVHPPEIKAIVKARVMTDKKAARILARLHAANLLPSVWVPPREVRDLRAIIAQRRKMVNLSTQAKNRLQSLLHRHQIMPPVDCDLYDPETRSWWESQPLSALEHFRMQTDLDTLIFARDQVSRLEACLSYQAVEDDRVPLLVQLPGIGLINAMSLLAAIGDICRFPSAKHLVGYAGLGASVHASGETTKTGRITKTGRRDLRHTMVEAAHIAASKHPHWKAQFRKLEKRLGKQKAKVAIARKLLVVVWHVLTKREADRHSTDEQLAAAFFAHAYKVGVRNLSDGQSATQFTRQQLDRLGVGQALEMVRWGSKRPKLPPSTLPT